MKTTIGADYIDNMRILAEWLTNHQGIIELDMSDYSCDNKIPTVDRSRDCGSSACGIGWAAVALPGANRYRHDHDDWIDFAKFAKDKFGEDDGGSNYGRFLFSGRWEDDLQELIGRLKYVIHHGEAPSYQWGEDYFSDDVSYYDMMKDISIRITDVKE